jgi:hypothetical protein
MERKIRAEIKEMEKKIQKKNKEVVVWKAKHN